jgi:hypothetical protein
VTQLQSVVLYLAAVGFVSSGIFIYAHLRKQEYFSYKSETTNLTWGLRLLGVSFALLAIFLVTL